MDPPSCTRLGIDFMRTINKTSCCYLSQSVRVVKDMPGNWRMQRDDDVTMNHMGDEEVQLCIYKVIPSQQQ